MKLIVITISWCRHEAKNTVGVFCPSVGFGCQSWSGTVNEQSCSLLDGFSLLQPPTLFKLYSKVTWGGIKLWIRFVVAQDQPHCSFPRQPYIIYTIYIIVRPSPALTNQRLNITKLSYSLLRTPGSLFLRWGLRGSCRPIYRSLYAV